MAEEDRTVSTRATDGGGSDPRDDWLAEDAGDLDWFPEDDAQGHGAPGSRATQAAGRSTPSTGGGSPAVGDLNEFLRRRGTLIILIAAVAVIILVAILAFGGGGGGSSPSVTTPPTTAPATTTPPTTAATTTTKQTTTAKSTATTVTGSLRSGDTGAEVKTLQQSLITLGYTGLKADGNFGPATAAAVTAFQTANGLTADGIVGQKTADTINAALTAKG
jgi:hypothetical protein